MDHPEVIDIHTAAEFVSRLRRSSPEWLGSGDWLCPWIFRGVDDSKHDLVPKAWRDEVTDDPIWKQIETDMKNEGPDPDCEKMSDPDKQRFLRLVLQYRFEHAAVVTFVHLADELGFPIPGERLPDYNPSDIKNRMRIVENYKEPFHPSFALAQHHGVPTRLLDWTRNPLIAAFFASLGVPDPGAKGRIVVWAMKHNAQHKGKKMRLFTVPRSGLGYLHAQDALFSYVADSRWHFQQTGRWPGHIDNVPVGALKKLTLPKSEVPELKRLLSGERISKAHMMPTLDNVRSAVQDIFMALSRDPLKQ